MQHNSQEPTSILPSRASAGYSPSAATTNTAAATSTDAAATDKATSRQLSPVYSSDSTPKASATDNLAMKDFNEKEEAPSADNDVNDVNDKNHESTTKNDHSQNGSASTSERSNSMDLKRPLQCVCKHKHKCKWSRTLALRILFVLSLIMAVIICSIVSFLIIRDLELQVGRQAYESVAASVLTGARAVTLRRYQGAKVMESILSFAFPDADTWPFVFLDGYFYTAGLLTNLATSGSMGFTVLVQPGQQAQQFERHAEQHYQRQGYPSAVGTSDFGFGIWKTDRDKNQSLYPDGRVPSQTGNDTDYGSNYTILAPLMQHTIWNAKGLMYDIHDSDTAVDAMIDCSETALEQREPTVAPTLIGEDVAPPILQKPPCTVTTGFKSLISRPKDVATVVDEPIYPANDPNTLVGFVATPIHWIDVLTNVVPDYVGGLRAVISADSQMHANTGFDTITFEIVNGIPVYLGEGDLHAPEFEGYARTIVLNDVETRAATSVKHRLTVYPTSFDQFATQIPLAVSVGFACVIAICTIIFLVYDWLMRRDINERKVVLEMKRKFVRFVSHEIRTPLNTVCMGLELLESELVSYQSNTTSSPSRNSTTTSTATTTAMNQNATLLDPSGRPPSSSLTIAEANYLLEITQDIQENASSAVGILNVLLKYDKIESGNLELDISHVNLWELVPKVVGQFRLQALRKDIDMTFTVNAGNIYETDLEAGTNPVPDAVRSLVALGDEMRISEVIRNLCSNALKFTSPGGKIDISMTRLSKGLPHKKRRNGRGTHEQSPQMLGQRSDESDDESNCNLPRAGSIVLEVTDSGVGMTAKQLAKVFEEGTQFNVNRLQAGGGSGLGLCISKSIIERHNGTIIAKSPGLGHGCTFRVELPLYDAGEKCRQENNGSTLGCESLHTKPQNSNNLQPTLEDSNPSLEKDPGVTETFQLNPPCRSEQLTMPSQAATANSALLPSDGRPTQPPPLSVSRQEQRHVLVVDDVLSNRKMLIRLLERAGHTCSSAEDGQQAIAVFLANREAASVGKIAPISCILMDYEMPVLNGPDATYKLRQLGYEGTVLGVTGNALVEDCDYFKWKGADDVLPKPVSLALLNNYWRTSGK